MESLRMPSSFNLKHHPLVTGTLLLTATGFISRILGFIYRIFLSRTIGAEGLGIYQMIFPIYSICMAICSSGIETSISRFVAANRTHARSFLRIGLFISLSLAFCMTGLIFCFSDFFAVHILLEPRCTSLLSIMAFAIPWTAFHNGICGYCYGTQKALIPGISHLVELTARMIVVFLIASYWLKQGQHLTVMLAVYGLLAGEMASAIFTAVSYMISSCSSYKPSISDFSYATNRPKQTFWKDFSSTASSLMSMSIPLLANRLVLSGLQSAEAILIPNRLMAFGLSSSEAISSYGTLTGMALPFILFPSTISTSLAIMLLPTVSQAQAEGKHSHIRLTTEHSISFSLIIGILFTGIFLIFGQDLGNIVFHNQAAGIYITILAWLCPFLYLGTTLGSILNGLGKTGITFFNHVIAQIVILGFVIFAVPQFGIMAYLWGNLAAELLLTFLHILALKKEIAFSFSPLDTLLKPILYSILAFGILLSIDIFLSSITFLNNPWILLIIRGSLYTVSYLFFLFLFGKRQ